jgi:enoyl-[acyl-carrier protein] reductase III
VELKGKTAFITGGTKGIGKQVALKLADLGCDVAINYFRSRDAAAEAIDQLEAKGVRCRSYRANIGRTEKLGELVDQVVRDFGKIDIFVSNAALGTYKYVLDVDEKTWDLPMRTNAQAFLFLTQAIERHMPDHGRIVALSSLGAHRYIPGYSATGVSKAAIETLVRYLCHELARRQITVNAVSGGWVDTDALKVFPNYDELLQQVIERTPMGRIGSPEEVADVVVFLCTAKARWINGQVIVVDGGYSSA